MTASWHVLLDVAWRSTVIYFALLIAIRLTGQRPLGQLAPFDLVLLLIIANAVQNAMVGPSTSLLDAARSGSWDLALRCSERAREIRRIARVLYHSRSGARPAPARPEDLRALEAHCRRAGITRDDLLQALREHGVARPDDVRLAVLEPDGMISVIRYDDLQPGTRPHHRIRMMRRASGT